MMELSNEKRKELDEYKRIGKERFNEYIQKHKSTQRDLIKTYQSLSWIELEEDMSTPSFFDNDPDNLALTWPVLEELDAILLQIIQSRGPGLLGYLNKISFNTGFEQPNASFYPDTRRIRINWGLIYLINDLLDLFVWFDDFFFKSNRQYISFAELEKIEFPNKISDLLLNVYDGSILVGKRKSDGLYPASSAIFGQSSAGDTIIDGRLSPENMFMIENGMQHPLGRAILRFIIAHEFGHMIFLAESPEQQNKWLETVRRDYDDALESDIKIFDDIPARNDLPDEVVGKWMQELVADGMGCYVARNANISSKTLSEKIWRFLPIGLTTFFYLQVISRHTGRGDNAYPPPLLRDLVIAANLRKEFKLSWEQFMTEMWGTGLIAGYLYDKWMRSLKQRRVM